MVEWNRLVHFLKKKKRKYELKFASGISKDFAEEVKYYHNMGKWPNIKHPKDLVEKLIWLNRYWITPEKILCADKLRMHTYLKNKGLECLSVKIIGVWENAKDIDFDILPTKFVLKCNHGSGYVIIVEDKNLVDKQAIISQLNKWLLIDYSQIYAEHHYHYIKRCIIAEEFLEQEGGIIDYKIYCFNGIPHSFLVCSGRTGGKADFSSYSLKWEKMRLRFKESMKPIKQPLNLEKMIDYARVLSHDFPFVRLDFYEIQGNLYLGEFTFTPLANEMYYNYSYEILCEFGDLLKLPQESNRVN